jgi:nitroimidazol reductase NimA-like FMN-containing flavoprotein (pyridoxamine 5'-phosphate oxidase superfamily)
VIEHGRVATTRKPVDDAGLEVLDDADCIRLLEAGGVGRVALPGEPPVVRPVNFVLDGRRVVVRTSAGSLWNAARTAPLVTFEIDAARNVDHRGWSVIASGRLSTLETDDDVLALPLRAWAPKGRDRFVAITISALSGRQLTRA